MGVEKRKGRRRVRRRRRRRNGSAIFSGFEKGGRNGGLLLAECLVKGVCVDGLVYAVYGYSSFFSCKESMRRKECVITYVRAGETAND